MVERSTKQKAQDRTFVIDHLRFDFMFVKPIREVVFT